MCYGFENREMESFLPDTDAVNQMTARILAGAGRRESTNGAAMSAAAPGVEITTLEIPARV